MSWAKSSAVRGPVATMTCPLLRQGLHLAGPEGNVGMPLDGLGDGLGKGHPVHRQSPPAATRWVSAHRRIREFSRRSSSFSRPTAFSSWSDRRELEHTNSPSRGSGGQGSSCPASSPTTSRGSPVGQPPGASHPARPAPRIVTGSAMLFLQTRRRGRFLCRCSLLRRSFLGGLLGCRLFWPPASWPRRLSAAAAVFLVAAFARRLLGGGFLGRRLGSGLPLGWGGLQLRCPLLGRQLPPSRFSSFGSPPASPLEQRQGRPR